jgi:hypothetical protein
VDISQPNRQFSRDHNNFHTFKINSDGISVILYSGVRYAPFPDLHSGALPMLEVV